MRPGAPEGLDESSPVRRGGWGMVPQWWRRPVGTCRTLKPSLLWGDVKGRDGPGGTR